MKIAIEVVCDNDDRFDITMEVIKVLLSVLIILIIVIATVIAIIIISDGNEYI